MPRRRPRRPGRGPGWLVVEPVVQVHLGAFAEVSAEPAFAAQASQLPGARPGYHEPVPADDAVLHCAGILEQERAARPPSSLVTRSMPTKLAAPSARAACKNSTTRHQ